MRGDRYRSRAAMSKRWVSRTSIVSDVSVVSPAMRVAPLGGWIILAGPCLAQARGHRLAGCAKGSRCEGRLPAVRVERWRPVAAARRELSQSVREAYSLYIERAVEGDNEADGPFSAACYEARRPHDSVSARTDTAPQPPPTMQAAGTPQRSATVPIRSAPNGVIPTKTKA